MMEVRTSAMNMLTKKPKIALMATWALFELALGLLSRVHVSSPPERAPMEADTREATERAVSIKSWFMRAPHPRFLKSSKAARPAGRKASPVSAAIMMA